jgi:hypothetical protein
MTSRIYIPILSFFVYFVSVVCPGLGFGMVKKRNEPKLSSVSGLSSLDSGLILNKRTHIIFFEASDPSMARNTKRTQIIAFPIKYRRLSKKTNPKRTHLTAPASHPEWNEGSQCAKQTQIGPSNHEKTKRTQNRS